ncbi:MAG: AzlD domain-containing protein [Acidimicrobiia bacterium]|nr:AzlD domain-containing protein [Acidimicrobiia bacterium]
MTDLAIVVAIGVGTYGLRLSFIGALGTRPVPPAIERPLRFIAPAVLGALIAPALVRPEGVIDLGPGNLRLVAGGIAALVAWRTKNIAATTAAGLLALWLLDTAA